MKKLIILFISLSMFILLACCNSNNSSRNPDYTYGTYDGTIGTVYELTNDISYDFISDYSSNNGQSKTYPIRTSETACGGVVAFGEGIYVYSPNNDDADEVKSELIKEVISIKQDK